MFEMPALTPATALFIAVVMGPPSADEMKLLEPFRASLAPEVFGEAYVPPVSDGSGRDRKLLKQASDLLAAAGWRQQGDVLVDEEGAPLEVEFLIEAAVFQRVISPYVENLKAIGVNAYIREVDPAQYQTRLKVFQFDVVGVARTLGATPLEGLSQLFGSKAADIEGSDNLAGIKDKVVDALLDKLPGVTSREGLIAITRATDRVLRSGHYWVENWYQPNHRVGHWDLFGRPEEKPDYAFTPETTWWFDRDRAAAAGKPDG